MTDGLVEQSPPTQPPTLTRPPIYRDQRYPCYIDVDILSHNIVIDPLLSVTIVLWKQTVFQERWWPGGLVLQSILSRFISLIPAFDHEKSIRWWWMVRWPVGFVFDALILPIDIDVIFVIVILWRTDDDYDGGRMNDQMTRRVCLQCFVRHFNLLSGWIKTKRQTLILMLMLILV